MKRNPVAWAALIVASAALVSSSGFLRPMPAAPKAPLEGQQAAKALSQAYENVAEFVRPSVVQIMVQKKGMSMPNIPGLRRFPGAPRGNDNLNPRDFRDFEDMLRRYLNPDGVPEKEQFGNPRGAVGVGSGFIYDNRGHILTNNHVVENAEKIKVFFYDGVEVSAKVVGTDSKTDVAVIKVENTSYPALPKGDSSDLKVGEMVMAVGSPFNLSQSVTAGIISALDRSALGINGNPRDTYESFIQTDAPINRGNSGGPLLNMNGEVIGVNSAIVSGGSGNDGIGFAIPMKIATSVADMLIKDGKVHYARIGIGLTGLTPALARQFGLDESTKGVVVGEVYPGTPADKAGLKPGDVIVGFAGDKVQDASSFRLRVATSEAARPYELVYFREGDKKTTSIVPAPEDKVAFEHERKAKAEDESASAEPAKTTINAFGLEVQPLTPDLARPLGLPANLQGVVVTSVKGGSPAESAGIEEGDVITKVIRDHRPQPLTSVQEFQSLASTSNELAIYVRTKRGSGFVILSKEAK
jgi:serine protease Do